MLPPKLAALFGEMEKVRGETMSVLSGLTEEEFSRKAGEEWSAVTVLMHERDHQEQLRRLLARMRG